MFYAITEDQDYWEQRLNLFVALAPVTRIDHCKSKVMRFVSTFIGILDKTFDFLKIYHILGDKFNFITKIACGIDPEFCQYSEGFLITQTPDLDDPVRFQAYMGHFPAGASTQSLVHYGQMIKSKQWTLFDWGSAEANEQKYGQSDPPRVEIENLTSLPTAMFVGTSDDLADTTDAQWARDQINAAGDALKHY